MTDKIKDSSAPMELIILTPHGKAVDVRCDSVQLTLCDDENGRGGGLVGFHRGHLPAVLALGNGVVNAALHGEIIFHSTLHGGFASVRDDVIRVISDSEIEPPEQNTED